MFSLGIWNLLTSVQFIDAAPVISECRDDSYSTLIGIDCVTSESLAHGAHTVPEIIIQLFSLNCVISASVELHLLKIFLNQVPGLHTSRAGLPGTVGEQAVSFVNMFYILPGPTCAASPVLCQ